MTFDEMEDVAMLERLYGAESTAPPLRYRVNHDLHGQWSDNAWIGRPCSHTLGMLRTFKRWDGYDLVAVNRVPKGTGRGWNSSAVLTFARQGEEHAVIVTFGRPAGVAK